MRGERNRTTRAEVDYGALHRGPLATQKRTSAAASSGMKPTEPPVAVWDAVIKALTAMEERAVKAEEHAVKTEEALMAIAKQLSTVKLDVECLKRGMTAMIREQVTIIVQEQVATIVQKQVTAVMQDQILRMPTTTIPSPSYADIARTPPGSQPSDLRTLSMGTTPSSIADTLYCTVDTSRIEEHEKGISDPGTTRQAIEREMSGREGHGNWRCVAVTKDPRNATRIRVARRNEEEMGLVKEAAQKSAGAGVRVLRDQLFPQSWMPQAVTEQRHSGSCQKCEHKSKATGLKIDIHEWPLPVSATNQKAVVFEMRPPFSFIHWRDSLVFLRINVLQAEYTTGTRARAQYPLSTDEKLARFATGQHRRIGLLSEDKPHTRTHRKTMDISKATDAKVCLASGLNYKYYDSGIGTFINGLACTDKVSLDCTYKLPRRSTALQKFINRTSADPHGKTSNTVIATLSDCPSHMSLDEYRKLASIPCGSSLQWPNILVQLGIPAINFKNAESTIVLLQCIYQAGPASNDVLRVGHAFCGDPNSAAKLLKELGVALRRIEGNWESTQALSVFISIAARLLTLSSSDNIRSACLAYLEGTRVVALDWMSDLSDKSQHVSSEGRSEYMFKRAEVALICIDSFNIDDVPLATVLASSEQASILIQCTITLLVNGLPLDRLPHKYEDHASYRVLFGRATTIEVIPSAVPGLQFAAKRRYLGYELHFGLSYRGDGTTTDLMVQASKNGKQYELVTPELFCAIYPAAFSEEYFHWYDIDAGVVEFRPIKDAWSGSGSRTWTLIPDQRTATWRLTKDSQVLLSLPSATSKALTSILLPLADHNRIHIISQPSQQHSATTLPLALQPSLLEVEVEIPGLQLCFRLEAKQSELRSKEFPNTFIDRDQSLGVLVGLQNRLILRQSER
ncbi:hypothetical protein B0A55_12708 [Friedmanniomyces simplex]|uniref:Uncharacterized protein n=1 Tax=Friedmanniomyces simplex TaxID=329884 RepID=A0A4U0WGT1_9PEZI|nr:hypothetical protein B0A55_12708 [Friedmanniomyces simplex]